MSRQARKWLNRVSSMLNKCPMKEKLTMSQIWKALLLLFSRAEKIVSCPKLCRMLKKSFTSILVQMWITIIMKITNMDGLLILALMNFHLSHVRNLIILFKTVASTELMVLERFFSILSRMFLGQQYNH